MRRILTRQFGKELPSFPGAKDHNLDKGNWIFTQSSCGDLCDE
jgi:hypothetical protein